MKAAIYTPLLTTTNPTRNTLRWWMNCNPDISEGLAIQSAHIQYCDLEGQITALVPCSIRRSARSISETDTQIYTHMPSASHMVVVHMCMCTYLHARLIRSHSIPAPHILTADKEMISMNISIFHLKYIPYSRKIMQKKTSPFSSKSKI